MESYEIWLVEVIIASFLPVYLLKFLRVLCQSVKSNHVTVIVNKDSDDSSEVRNDLRNIIL